MAELRKSYSNYTLRKKRQLTTKGGIYERDWMTVSELDGFAPGTLPVYASGNFKLTINSDRGGKKKYSFSNWALNDNGTEEWTLNVIKEEELKITNALIKPNYSSILDFAYYGSAVELIRGSVNDIYAKFPGELYLTNRTLRYATTAGTFVDIENVVENPFLIDVYSSYVNENRVENKYRYMYLSWDKYELVNDETGEVIKIIDWRPGTATNPYCLNNGDKVFEDAKLYLDYDCQDEGGGGSVQRKSGRKIDADTCIIPLGNDSAFYYPALQLMHRDIHEYNNPYDGNIRGGLVNENEVDIPLGNDSGWEGRTEDDGTLIGYNRRLLRVNKETHEYGSPTGSPSGEKTELIPFVELTPKNVEDCASITFSGTYIDGNVYLSYDNTTFTGWHIRLQEKYVDEIFDSFDDFEKVLLDRDTKPKYKAKFYTPKVTDRGVVTFEKSYVWPTLLGGWNLDMIGQTYESYLNGLLYIATYYDECRSDNIWRSYTHESIKNFDWTTPRETYIPEIDGELIDTERMESILKVCGRQFDDLKRYIENIKYTVNVSYDSKNNMPDQNMAKFLEMAGWEVKNVSPINDNSLVVKEEYPGKTVKVTPEDCNKEFLKRMILNSRNILSKKGTRAGIETMYSMFGIFDFRNGDEISGITAGFMLDEHIAFTENYIYGPTFEDIAVANTEKNNYAKQYERTENDFAGLMADHKFDIDGVQYLVPWYNIDEIYDGYAYYQMLGGWGRRQWKKIILDLAPNIAEIESDTAFTIYDETVKNVKVSESFTELNKTPIGFLSEGDIYYVLNLNYEGCSDDTGNTHYVFFTGGTGDVHYSDDYGWVLVKYSDFEGPASGLTWFAKKILYMESIHDNNIGNNPHNGNGRYDGGKEYFEYYKELFKGAFENNLFDNYHDRVVAENAKRRYDNRFRTQKLPDITDDTSLVSGVGFNISADTSGNYLVVDNEKIWYFTDYDNGLYRPYPDYRAQTLHYRKFGEDAWGSIDFGDFLLAYEDMEFQNKPIAYSGDTHPITVTGGTLVTPEEVRNYYENGRYGSDYIQGYSVINTKNIRITYRLPWALQDYVEEIVEFYVKQLIPSTAIVEFVWDKDYCDQWGERPAATRPDVKLKLSPAYQRLRSYESEAEIDITAINVRDVQIENESIITN